jgi:phospholipid/cholesterol/gamma-HCH transport system substrate-binding protein
MPRSQTNISLRQVRVGIFVIIAIAVLIFLVLNASGDINPFSSKLHLRARFIDANGLREGSEVRLAGVRVGKVERIVLLEPSPVADAPRLATRC